MANVLQLTNMSVYKIWKIVKKTKRDTPFPIDDKCNRDGFNKGLYSDLYEIKNHVGAIERQFNITPSKPLARFRNMTEEKLEIAAEMFIYLIICPNPDDDLKEDWLASWSEFYIDLLKHKSPEQIIFTLKKVMKNPIQKEKEWASKLLRRAVALIPLYYEDIRSLLPGRSDHQSFTRHINKALNSEILTISQYSNHPVHIISKDNKMSPSALIPFCDFGGNMSAVGIKIDQFEIPVCNIFEAKIFNNQRCYEADINKFRNKKNNNRDAKFGFTFFMDYNLDRQSNDIGVSKLNSKQPDISFASTIMESNQKKHAFIYLDTIGEIFSNYY